MTDGFVSYREDFEAFRDEARDYIKNIPECSDAARREDLIRQAENSISEAERYLKILESEARSGDASSKRKMQQTLRGCKSHAEKLRNDFERAKLIGDSRQRSKQPTSRNPKDHMVNYQENLDRQGNYLTEGQRIIAETEQIGVNIDNNLANQRELLENAQENVQETRENTAEAGTHLSSLARKTFSNILCLWGVIILLLAGIGYAAYSKFSSSKK